MNLLERTRALLKARLADPKVTLRQIARESRGKVDYEWLAKFAQEKVADPGVNRVQALHDSLKTNRTASNA